MLGPQAARWHQQHVQQRPAVVGVVAGMRDAGQGGRECGLVVGPRGLEQGPDLGCFRLGIVAVRRLAIAVPGRLLPRHGRRWRGHRHRAVRQGHLENARRGGVRSGPGRGSYRSNGQQAGDGPSNRFSQHVFALQETVEPGACGPDQASCSGRVGLRPDLSDFGLRAAARETQLQRLSGLQAGGIAQDASLRVAGNRISRASVLPGSSARSCAPAATSRLRACRRSRAWAWPSCRAAFATRSAARRVSGLRCSRRCASKATRALRACGADQADASRKPRLFRRSR